MAVVAPVPRRSARTPRGFRPTYPGEAPTLGWGVLEWAYACLPDPRDDATPLVLTDEQARRVLRIYEVDPVAGKRQFTHVHQEEAKGWGKGPLAAVLGLAEFGGAPVVFDGWDAQGQPVGRPWGSRGLPSPLVQVVAVSEAQTYNVWKMVMRFVAGARGDLSDVVTVDSGRPGRTMLRRRDMPEAEMARVTASAITREGSPDLVHSILDEVEHWTPENGGIELANVVVRNLDKSGGWAHFLGNAPVLGHGSVAEVWGEPAHDGLHFATRPSVRPEPEWTQEQLLGALGEVYDDVLWIDIPRQLASVTSGRAPWEDVLRFKFNVRTEGGIVDGWMDMDLWGDAAGEVALSESLPTYAAVRVAHDHRSAAVAVAQREGQSVRLQLRSFDADDEDFVQVDPIEQHILDLRRQYRRKVVAGVSVGPGRKVVQATRPGPEVVHHGAFFESSRQRLAEQGVVFLDVPSTPEQLMPAAETLMRLLTAGELAHDGNEELAAQMARLVAEERPKGWAVKSGEGATIAAAQAAMLAVHRAVTAPEPPPDAPRIAGGF